MSKNLKEFFIVSSIVVLGAICAGLALHPSADRLSDLFNAFAAGVAFYGLLVRVASWRLHD